MELILYSMAVIRVLPGLLPYIIFICLKLVKKTLSIPEWMNEEAVARGVNFSQVLQEALMSKLNIGFMDESLM